MKAYTLRNERIAELSQTALKGNIRRARNRQQSNIWIRLVNPTPEEILFISGSLPIPEQELKEFMEEDERPRFDTHKYLQLIYRVPFFEQGDIVTTPITIFVYKNILVTVEKSPTRVMNNIEELVKKGRRRFLFKKSPITFIIYFIDKVNDEFLATTDKIADTLELFRGSEPMNKEMTKKVYSLSITLSFFHQALVSDLEILNTLRKMQGTVFSMEEKKDLGELYIDSLQILDVAKVQREMLMHLFSLQSIITSKKLNEYLKKLTLLTLIIMIPTLIASMYGMNIKLPFSSNPYAFVIVIAGMLISVIVGLKFSRMIE